jgi:glycine/serine hydroxymethyltransferase
MFSYSQQTLRSVDPDLWANIQQEHKRQEQPIQLIVSENYTSPAVMSAQGSQLTNKYAEGHPSRRYYSNCAYVHLAEQPALDRLKKLCDANAHGWAANVQRHSGAQANETVFASVKVVNAARIALHGGGRHHVSLDKVIKTMWQTGADMKTKYKEASRVSLAVNIVECL